MRLDNIAVLEDTLRVLGRGSYELAGERVPLKLSREQMEEVQVFLPEDIRRVSEINDPAGRRAVLGRCAYGCVNIDSFSLARKRMQQYAGQIRHNGEKPVLVLNLANPVHPGGGVRGGAKAQEEDLCRKSSLLLSLESRAAKAYYDYNRALDSDMGSDALMIHPQVEIIKDENAQLLPETVVVAVMTCAAPILRRRPKNAEEQAAYEQLLLQRITGMLTVAAYAGYERLVLGAFGCGAFGNDARVVSDMFYKALKEFRFNGMREHDLFRSIDFAVLTRPENTYNFDEFTRNFSSFYRDVDQRDIDRALEEKKKTEVYLDAIRGCIFGGAAGDALGYPVEFLHEDSIFGKYGQKGITSYDISPYVGKAQISDDTQMTLFTANGLLVGDTRSAMRGIMGAPRGYVRQAYLDWLKTQEMTIEEVNSHERFTKEGGVSWLLDVPELYRQRAPGNTCLSALRAGGGSGDYEEDKMNDSKGCGGIMRVAPMAVRDYHASIERLDEEGAALAAITHGHSLGYMPAAVLVHVIHRIIFSRDKMSLKEIVLEARDTAEKIFEGDPYLPELTAIINKAVALSEDGTKSDLDCIHELGEGWVAEETLGIALYCALKYRDDFSAGIIAAVNHNGDSDSTGAVTGNILGALVGFDAIEEKWKQDLELSDLILEVADDLCHGCQMDEYSAYYDPDWAAKYIHMHRPEGGY